MPKKWHIDWALKFLVNPPNPYYQQNPNSPHPYYQQIQSQPHIYPNYNPQITSFSVGQGLTSFPSSSQYPSSSNQYLPSSNIIPIQQLVVDFHRYIQRVRDVPHQHPTQASRNPRSNPELRREGRELPQLMMHLGGAITNKL
jgi:hypothetical protein